LHNRSTNTLSADPSVQKVATAQELIGWHHILKGRFTKEWRFTQDKYLKENHIHSKKKNRASWLTTVIDTLFKEWNKLWDLRNIDIATDMTPKQRCKQMSDKPYENASNYTKSTKTQ
jgi:hypothetical protein